MARPTCGGDDQHATDHQAWTTRAFLIHLRLDADPSRGSLRGRIQHVRSGDAAHFDSLDELVAFIRHRVAVESG